MATPQQPIVDEKLGGHGAPPTSTQPAAQPGMQIAAGGPRNALGKPVNASGKREWSHGTFDCFGDIGTCAFTCCCPCLQFQKNVSRLESLNKENKPAADGGEMFGGDCCIFTILSYCGLHCFATMGKRKAIRERYDIDDGNDFLCTWCCQCCSLVQESRELELEERVLEGKPIEHKK